MTAPKREDFETSREYEAAMAGYLREELEDLPTHELKRGLESEEELDCILGEFFDEDARG